MSQHLAECEQHSVTIEVPQDCKRFPSQGASMSRQAAYLQSSNASSDWPSTRKKKKSPPTHLALLLLLQPSCRVHPWPCQCWHHHQTPPQHQEQPYCLAGVGWMPLQQLPCCCLPHSHLHPQPLHARPHRPLGAHGCCAWGPQGGAAPAGWQQQQQQRC
jgi:hypothetical protein